MSKDKIADYDGTTAGNNTDIGGISIAEGMLPSAVNNSMRELTKQLGAFANGTDAIDALTVTGDLTVDTNPLHVDATNNRVGIGTTAPDSDLKIKSTGAATLRLDGGAVASSVGPLIVGEHNDTDAFYIGTNSVVLGESSNQDVVIYGADSSSGNIRFYAGASTETVRIRDGGGITFNGDTAAANALDSYEEGTFTPSFTGGLTGSSYGDQNGTYVKIGQLVFFVIELDITNGQATANGNQIKIDSIPFVSAAASPMIYGQGGAWVIFNNNFYNVDTGIYLQIPTNTNQIKLYRGAGNALAGNDSGVNGQNDLHIAGCYRTA